ncbi:LacI family transcriptional regulator [Erysipelothrix sp. HDW6C]|uniref:LacI family DNA-binding transcriptional regulator n=1 Tax=Erysipelothrix sp. HDW6C TaxID=2714930 RepID=UPI00140932EE|nr:LacI family DNA-binding transcriptional regulator [Erysipelothrix sp. HDW6C]QIK68991.1 LacI family transcriptional regulator [Erysipelothrix sp. HDW6C]
MDIDKTLKPTIEDVAMRAGVSIATVSRVINGKDRVKPETKQRVHDAIKELGFEIRKGELLSDNESKTILVCVTEMSNPFNVPVLDGIQETAANNGYDILFLQTKNQYTTYADYEAFLKSQNYAGIIFLSSITQERYTPIVDVLRHKSPLVFCSEYIGDESVSYVCIDDEEAMRKSASYMLSLGRKNIAFINSSLKLNYARLREKGFRAVMSEHNVPVNEQLVTHLSAVDFQLAYSNILHILNQKDKPDGIICVSDVYAIAALKACRKKGLRVPEDCAIIGFDNIEISTMVDPPLTTIEQPNYQLGSQACELLIERIITPGIPAKQIYLETELIVRESTPMTIKEN